ncbi:hypothetical protein [Paraburkholderia caledonica]|uniref:hypothetical protein n=1 Tax=Paraburkholderia caledonica TaxID=134536 RepID=UPI0038BAFF92
MVASGILPFGLSQPEKCAHLTAHPSIFREREPGRKPDGAARQRGRAPFAGIPFKTETIGLQRAFSHVRHIASQALCPWAMSDAFRHFAIQSQPNGTLALRRFSSTIANRSPAQVWARARESVRNAPLFN